jgi:hypothetical protein
VSAQHAHGSWYRASREEVRRAIGNRSACQAAREAAEAREALLEQQAEAEQQRRAGQSERRRSQVEKRRPAVHVAAHYGLTNRRFRESSANPTDSYKRLGIG